MFEIELFIWIKMDLALNNLQWLICHKTKPNQTKNLVTRISERPFSLNWLLLVSSCLADLCLVSFSPWFILRGQGQIFKNPNFSSDPVDTVIYLISQCIRIYHKAILWQGPCLNQDSCMVGAKILNSVSSSLIGEPQAPSNKLSPASRQRPVGTAPDAKS